MEGRVVDTAAQEQAWNSGQLGEAAAGAAQVQFRVWTYDAASVVLGCSQAAMLEDVRRRLAGRADVLLRESGGGAVLTGPWLVSASVVVPPDHDWVRGGILDGYRRMAEVHLAALADLRVRAWAVQPAAAAPCEPAGPAARWACFAALSPWEVVDRRRRKLIGLAQRRRSAAVLLVAGTLVSAPDWPLLCDAVGDSPSLPHLRAHTTDCRELAGASVEPARLADRLETRLAAALAVARQAP